MPFVDLFSTDDFVSIYYITNSQFGNVGGFDPQKPTVLILHPTFFDTQWLDYHWGDPRLYKNFNLIAFDMRCSGRTVSRPSTRHDTWVEAADIALCHLKLRLPPCHILALETTSVCVALRLVVLFPELCLSLALCNVPSPLEPDWAFRVLDETIKRWCFAKDIETFKHGGVEAVNLLCGYVCYALPLSTVISYSFTIMQDSDPDLYDEVSDKSIFGQNELAEITQPVIIFHGERNDLHSMEHAENLQALLTGVEGGAALCPVMCGASNLTLDRNAASMLNNLYSKFLLTRVDRARSELRTEELLIEERMQRALFKLADIMERSDMMSGNPLSSLSFSCLSQTGLQRQIELSQIYEKDSEHSFSPLGPDGRLLRKYSDRDGQHWFEAGPSRLSIAGVY
ncbi:hypothetical protein AN958_10167 [Leucoagaricus sp. SymC.cos]|nr:hypothetical protein AN958_10167 [Leucoagaricus sp. SymC.cos]